MTRRWATVVLAALGVLFLYLAWVAARLELDYFDSYQAFLNGRTIWEGGGPYSINRAPFFPAVFALLFGLQRLLGAELLAVRAAHLLDVGLFALLLFTSYRLLRLHLSARLCWAAVVALGGSAPLVHVAPFFKEDLFVTLLATGAFYFYLRPGGPRRLVAAGLLLGLVGATKYNLLPLLLVVLGLHLLITRGRALVGREGALAAALLVGLPALVCLLVVMVVYARSGRALLLAAPARYLADFAQVFSEAQTQYQRDSAWLAYRFLIRALSPPLALCALAGVVVAVRDRRPGCLPHLLWLLVLLLAHAHWLAHKELRYLFPLFPPTFFFVVVGADALIEAATRRAGPRAPHLAVALSVALAIWPAMNLARECRRLADPVYGVPFEQAVSEAAAELAGSHRLHWVGPYYPVHPRDPVFDQADVTTSVYHFAPHVVTFHTRRPVNEAAVAPGPRAESSVFLLPQPAAPIEDGDVLIVNLEPREHTTATLPPLLHPLSLRQVHTRRLSAPFAAPAPGDTTPTVELRPSPGPGRSALVGRGVPAPWVVLQVDFPQAPSVGAVVAAPRGTFTIAAPPTPPSAITLKWLTAGPSFPLPR